MYKKQKNLFFFLSTFSWMGLCGFFIIYGLTLPKEVADTSHDLANSLLELFIPLTVTYIMALLLMLFIREKLRNTVWTADVLLATLYFGKIAMLVTVFLFAIDEFIFVPLWKHYKLKYQINKEIDKRVRE